MEAGAVKQAFNNEVIHLKQKMNQAKIQIIHKLTRKAKMLAEKKGPENRQAKLKRKAESAVNEVLQIKKVTTKDLAKFSVTHKGQLSDYLNKPVIDINRACARLLLHKSLQDKYNMLRTRYTNIAIDDLLMSREERRKIKQEQREKAKEKWRKKAEKDKWHVEDIHPVKTPMKSDQGFKNDPESGSETFDSKSTKLEETKEINVIQSNNDYHTIGNDSGDDFHSHDEDIEPTDKSLDRVSDNSAKLDAGDDNKSLEEDDEPREKRPKLANVVNKPNNKKIKLVIDNPDSEGSDHEIESESVDSDDISEHHILSKEPVELDSGYDNITLEETGNTESKVRDSKLANKPNKGTNLQNKKKNIDKIQKKRDKFQMKKIPAAPKVEETRVVDPFFITPSGESYMSLVEPRAPDEVKEEHQQGNRKLRRAIMFGRTPRFKAHTANFDNSNKNKFNNDTNFERNNKNRNNNKCDSKNEINKSSNDDKFKEKVPEKLHPSWEAKKKQSGIKPFEGKKIVFD